jgi:hypothetical protein
VDKNGKVTILKEKEVTITAEAAGHTASVTINGEGENAAGVNKRDYDKPDSKKQKDKDNSDKVKATTKATEPTTATKTKQRAYKKPDRNEEKKSTEDDKKRVFIAKEISIGNEIKPESEEGSSFVSVKSDAQALEEVEPYDKRVVAGSAAAAVLACGGGAVFRLRRYQIDLVRGMKKK